MNRLLFLMVSFLLLNMVMATDALGVAGVIG